MNTAGNRSTYKQSGFTLIELLVAVALSLILITAMIQTFNKAMEVFEQGSSKLEIYGEIRSAMGVMGRDLIGAVPTGSGAQQFVLAQNVDDQFPSRAQNFGGTTFGEQNGWVMTSGSSSNLEGGAADLLGFIGRTSIRGRDERVGIAYRIVPYKDASTLESDYDTVVHNRTLTSIQRVSISPATTVNGLKSGTSAQPKLYYGPDPNQSVNDSLWSTQEARNAGYDVAVGYLGKNVLSYNIEVHPGNTRNGFIDLNASSSSEQNSLTSLGQEYLNNDAEIENNDPYPLGDGSPANEPDLPDAIRITIRFTDGRDETQERAVQRVFWIPVD